MDERELSPALREAYREARETAEPSAFLWPRTRRSLASLGLLGGRGRRDRRARVVAAAAAATLLGFLAGFVAGRGAAPADGAAAPAAAQAPMASVERVQRLGTDYAGAVEALARSMEGGTASEVATGQQVLMALSSAHSDLVRTLVPAGAGATVAAAGDPSRAGARSDRLLIWF